MPDLLGVVMSLFDSGIRPAIDQWLLDEAKKLRDYGDYWSASNAGYCMRRVIFERLGVPKIESEADGRKQRVFTSGHLFHDWIQSITKKAGLSIAQELELQDEDLMIRGHIDDLVLIGAVPQLVRGPDGVEASSFTPPEVAGSIPASPAQLILYDYKTVNSRAFLWAKKNGNAMSYYHRMQLGTYMYMLRKMGETHKYREPGFPEYDGKTFKYKEHDIRNLTEARILKIEKDTLMMSEQQLMWSEELESEVFNYWNTLNAYWKNKKLPRCTCTDYEGGFLAKEAYNGYFYKGEPCSLDYYKTWKEKQNVAVS